VTLQPPRSATRPARDAGAPLAFLAPVLPVLAALVVWHPIRHNYFVADDFDHLFAVASRSLPWLLGQFWGGHLLLAYNVIYSGLFQLFASDPRGYFLTALLTHLLNTALLYAVIRRFAGNRLLACTGATFWGTCPALEGALGWFSVYGQVVLATIVLAVLATLGRHLETANVVSARRAAAWTIALAIGSTCFGIGLGLAAIFPVAAALALPRQQLPWRSATILALGAAATVTGYQLARVYSPGVGPYDQAIFSLDAMIRTSPAALVLVEHFLAYGSATLLLGFLGLDRGYPDSLTIAAAGATAVTVLAALRVAPALMRRRLLALALLALAAYGSIAAGRANLMVLANASLKWAGTQPRYHYLPLALLAALVSTALGALAARGRTLRLPIEAGAGMWTAARVAFLMIRPLAIHHAPEARAGSEAFVTLVHDTVAATPPGQVAVIQNRPFGPKSAMHDALIGSVGAFVIFFPDNDVDGRPVRFAVDDHDWELAQRVGGRVAALVVRAPVAPPHASSEPGR